MGFQRAQWHSGLTYQRTCDTCKTVLQYTDYSLDFRPWYADGFVDCPKCKTHLRHNESYAIDSVSTQPQVIPAPAAPTQEEPAYGTEQSPASEAPAPQEKPAYAVDLAEQTAAPAVFCTACGNKFGEKDRFCAQCGTIRS